MGQPFSKQRLCDFDLKILRVSKSESFKAQQGKKQNYLGPIVADWRFFMNKIAKRFITVNIWQSNRRIIVLSRTAHHELLRTESLESEA